jgi:hypothetical protein
MAFEDYSDDALNEAILAMVADIEKVKLVAAAGQPVDPDQFHRLVKAHRYACREVGRRRWERHKLALVAKNEAYQKARTERREMCEQHINDKRARRELSQLHLETAQKTAEAKRVFLEAKASEDWAKALLFRKHVKALVGLDTFVKLWDAVDEEYGRSLMQETA